MNQILFRWMPVALLLLPVTLFAQTVTRTIAPDYVYANIKQFAATTNRSPVAVNDLITGPVNRTVSGNVLKNDFDPEGKKLTVYLISASADGSIGLTNDGDFTFNPDKNFTGTSTSFSYKVCDGSLCSETATVTLSFPAAAPPATMLNDFSANADNNKVELKWSTNFETNNKRFDIERSTDGINFTKVGCVQAQGNTNSLHSYNLIQKVSRQTAGKNDLYYRLKLVGSNDEVMASKILIARVYKTKTLEMLSITPNPVVNDIKVTAQLNEGAYVVMKIVDYTTGQELMRKSVKSQAGINSFLLEGSNRLEKGLYFLETIINSNERMMVKLIKE